MSYKNTEWCREHFLNSLSEDVSPEEMADLGKMPTREIIRLYPDRWSDFCVIEGIEIEVMREAENG